MNRGCYIWPMVTGRPLPLFDPAMQPSTWNERMAPGEFAVHESTSKSATPFCTVFPSLADAEDYAQEQVAAQPTIQCRIYDHQGFVGAPIRELRGSAFKGEWEITSKLRRWVGSAFLITGITLVLIDWHSDFKLTWPALVGSRFLIPGALLLVTEGLILLQAKYGGHRK